MSKNIEKQYLKLLKDILDNGVEKQDRTGTGTISVFGRQIRHDMSKGFPLLTTKKMYWKGIVTELLWFLRGSTNIKYLVDNDCHIWDGDAYKFYLAHYVDEYNEELEKKNEGLGWMTQELVNIRPLSKEQFIEKIKTDDEFANKWGELGPVYGRQWRRWVYYRKGLKHNDTEWDYHTECGEGELDNIGEFRVFDQIANLINDLKTNPDSRRLMVNAWNVGELDSMTLPPCHYGFQVYTRELSYDEKVHAARKRFGFELEDGTRTFDINTKESIEFLNSTQRAISLMWNQRSVDTFLGLPFNIASYALLLEIIAKEVNMVPDELVGNLGDTHLYKNHIEQAKEQMTREPFPLPKLNINTEWWPTESGECGVGPIDAQAVLNGFSNDDFCKCLLEEDIQLGNYQSHPTIKAPLSN